jgi:hypothetical protein
MNAGEAGFVCLLLLLAPIFLIEYKKSLKLLKYSYSNISLLSTSKGDCQ